MNSTGSFPVFSLAFLASSGSILRLELARSSVPLINPAMPVPEPPPETEIETAGLIRPYSSAQACARLTIVSEPRMVMLVFSSLALARQSRTGSAASARAPNSRPVLSRERLSIGLLSVDLFSQDRLDQIPDVRVDVLERSFVGRSNLLGRTFHERRVLHVPVERHRLGWRRRENFLGIPVQRHDHLIVVQIGNLAHSLWLMMQNIQSFFR